MSAKGGSKGTKNSKGAKRSQGSKGGLRGRAGRLTRFLPVTPSGGAQAARTPFVLLVVLLLGGGLITLLMLNSSLNEGSFKLSKLRKQTTELTDDEQELQREVDSYSAPDALQRRARELGMVPGGDPAFLNPDGTIRGMPSPASLPSPLRQPARPPEAVRTTPGPSTAPSARPGPSASAKPGTPAAPAPSSSGR
ncbi:septum formation initiator family protein [Streptomyces sp. VRA16 Mangrove soil]|uniref:septum formation initiator family protein n=1 Tax=Streptomyces sp. VRA16 Mangrove soil TaxID=2817434 RepID=UPI001A9F4550|nr:septum formation initiator family protein [Streptomyces sp. VRA16 Mangrove soil]MBO1333406.1 septum formation initiator family protein [Streptomyces sp. VRA16 Mangrove soil]